MVFCGKRSRFRDTALQIFSSEKSIEPVNTMMYLGVHLDSQLTFNMHRNKLVSKVIQRTHIL